MITTERLLTLNQVLRFSTIMLITLTQVITYQRLPKQKNEFLPLVRAKLNNSLYGKKKRKNRKGND